MTPTITRARLSFFTISSSDFIIINKAPEQPKLVGLRDESKAIRLTPDVGRSTPTLSAGGWVEFRRRSSHGCTRFTRILQTYVAEQLSFHRSHKETAYGYQFNPSRPNGSLRINTEGRFWTWLVAHHAGNGSCIELVAHPPSTQPSTYDEHRTVRSACQCGPPPTARSPYNEHTAREPRPAQLSQFQVDPAGELWPEETQQGLGFHVAMPEDALQLGPLGILEHEEKVPKQSGFSAIGRGGRAFNFDLGLEQYQQASLCWCSSGSTRPFKHGPFVSQFWHSQQWM
ncbi:hypothetical protein Moror_7486 [Moniliophthora roreri MCA 2997]|uniref:Uncharacterized protein n=1 Tax=Moniliophthora roreri (strain MCA 2997) TaxID=1381753 RepID=V2WB05_MONRO|nr:hypothetical protein Moror_7486 [Moniliophthora roreri MCA 2997]